jgi:hypothetical protein
MAVNVALTGSPRSGRSISKGLAIAGFISMVLWVLAAILAFASCSYAG